MNTCDVCGKECKGKTCSGACRAKLSRRTRTQDSAQIVGARGSEVSSAVTTTGIDPQPDSPPASLEDYNDPDGRNYAKRSNPDLLNWGDPMSRHELESAGLKANRVTIPGDWDYTRVG